MIDRIPATVGIDPSLSDTGVAILRPGTRPVFTGLTGYSTKGASGISYEVERMRYVTRKVVGWIGEQFGVEKSEDWAWVRDRYDIWYVFEEPIPGPAGRMGKADERAGIRWNIASRLYPYGRLLGVHNRVVKKYWTGNGNADKALMLSMTRRRYPNLGMLDDNANDALAIANIAAEHRGHGLPPAAPQVNRAALAEVGWLAATQEETEQLLSRS